MSLTKKSITIFYINGCRHCIAAKNLLKSYDINYNQFNINYLDNQRWHQIQAMSQIKTVPQIFINGNFIGGNAELQTKSKDEILGDLESLPSKLEDLLGNLQEIQPENLGDPEMPSKLDPDSILLEKLKSSRILKDRSYGLFSKKLVQVVTEKDLQAWLERENSVPRLEFLLSKNLLQKFTKNNQILYQPTQFLDITAVNSKITPDRIPTNSKQIGQIINQKIHQINDKFVSSDGKSVDYSGIKNSPEFVEFKKLTALLHLLNLSELSDHEKLAFFINIYNTLVIHGFVENGVPDSFMKRLSFYKKTKYIIGSHSFSLDEIENGILRGNQKPPAGFSKLFAKTDPRLEFIVPNGQPKIHFALNCGAESCPPIKTFSADNIESELKLATAAFFEDPKSLTIVSDHEIKVSKILDWYKVDFGTEAQKVGEFILKNMDSNSGKYEKLSKMVENRAIRKISYWKYSWATNDKK